MRCKIIRNDMEVNNPDPRQVEGQVVPRRVQRNGKMVDRLCWKQGAVLSHPQAYRLVQQGVAIPADEECEEACQMSADGMAMAQHAFERLRAGIHHEDYAAYDAGYLSGYSVDEDGEQTWLPGRKGGREEWEALFEDHDDDE